MVHVVVFKNKFITPVILPDQLLNKSIFFLEFISERSHLILHLKKKKHETFLLLCTEFFGSLAPKGLGKQGHARA